MPKQYDAVVFDLLTALIDSWALWNDVAGSEADGMRWRQAYLGLTYGAGAYRPYETLVAEAAAEVGIASGKPDELKRRWSELQPWPEAKAVIEALAGRTKLAVVTNCSITMGLEAAACVSPAFDVVMTAEEAGFYKPRPEPYQAALKALSADPARVLFVAGSAADVPGAMSLGMTVYWHNRIGALPLKSVEPLYHQQSLDRVPAIMQEN
jgi:2-haloalkanoic acid dehalogenase type II